MKYITYDKWLTATIEEITGKQCEILKKNNQQVMFTFEDGLNNVREIKDKYQQKDDSLLIKPLALKDRLIELGERIDELLMN